MLVGGSAEFQLPKKAAASRAARVSSTKRTYFLSDSVRVFERKEAINLKDVEEFNLWMRPKSFKGR